MAVQKLCGRLTFRCGSYFKAPLTTLRLTIVQVFGCLHDGAVHTRQQQASEKRRGTKSRGARQYGGSNLTAGYGDLKGAPVAASAGGGERPAHRCEWVLRPALEPQWPGYDGKKAACQCAWRRS